MARGGALSLVRLMSGLVRIKILALVIGATGVGVYSLLLQMYLTGVALTSMSLAVPIINLGRRHVVDREFNQAGSIAGTAFAVISLNWIALLLVVGLFGQSLLAHFGMADVRHDLVWPVLIAILFGALSGGFGEGLSFVSNRFDAYVRAGIMAAVADMVFVAGAAWIYGLRGAVFAMPIGPFLMLATYWLSLRRDAQAAQVLRNLAVRVAELPRLFAYSGMMLGSVALTNLGLTFLRSRVLIEAGAAANGYLQVATSVSAYILSFITTGFFGHLYAHAAASGDTPEVRIELDKTLRLGLLISFCGCGTAAVLADFLIPLLYSGEFRPAAQLLTAYMPAELAFQFVTNITAYQLTVSLRRRYLALSQSYIGLLVISGLIFIPRAGALGYVGAHSVAAVTTLIAACTLARRSKQLSWGFLSLMMILMATLTAVCGILFYLRLRGYSGAILLPALVPFAIGGCVLLRQFLLDRRLESRARDSASD